MTTDEDIGPYKQNGFTEAKTQALRVNTTKEIIRIIFSCILILVGFIGALITRQQIFVTLIICGIFLYGIGKDILELIKT